MHNPYHADVIGIQYRPDSGAVNREKLTLAMWESRSQISNSNNSNQLLLKETPLAWETDNATYNDLVKGFLRKINQSLQNN